MSTDSNSSSSSPTSLNDDSTMIQALRLQPRVATTVTIVLIALFTAVVYISGRPRLGPGIKKLPRLPGIPWIGRLWDIPPSGAVVELARHFSKFHSRYGPIYEWQAFGVTRVLINSDSVAHDLLVQQGKQYSDKPDFSATLGMKAGFFLPLMGIGDTFSRHRNFVMGMMKTSRLQGFYGHPAVETSHTLRRLLENPSEEWSQSLVIHCARSAALCAWGSAEAADTLIEIVPPLLKFLSPGGPLPNQLPFLGHLPSFLSPWKQAEASRRNIADAAFMEAWSRAMKTVDGEMKSSWVRLWCDTSRDARSPSSKLDQEEAAHAIGTCAFVAIATIGSPLHAFFNAIAFHPSWLAQLQAEVDEVCGEDRLPCMEDVAKMPILRAVVKETIRWRPPIPFGVPHITNQDNVYNGYQISKDSIIMVNQLALSRNESLYPQPEEFRPERWLEAGWPTYREPLTQYSDIRGDPAFGHGVRACPGLELARTEIYTLISGLAWSFNIKRKEGREGQFVPWYETSPWIITMANSFPLDIEVRSVHKAQVLRELHERSDTASKFSGDQFGDRQGLAVRTEMIG